MGSLLRLGGRTGCLPLRTMALCSGIWGVWYGLVIMVLFCLCVCKGISAYSFFVFLNLAILYVVVSVMMMHSRSSATLFFSFGKYVLEFQDFGHVVVSLLPPFFFSSLL